MMSHCFTIGAIYIYIKSRSTSTRVLAQTVSLLPVLQYSSAERPKWDIRKTEFNINVTCNVTSDH